MSDPQPAEIQQIAEAVVRGEDTITVPSQMLVEPPPDDAHTRSLYARIREMTVGERIKLALKGNREARLLLSRDAVRLVQKFVLQNPRITEDEIIMMCKNRNTDSELLQSISRNREWSRSYQVKLALVQNPKSPVATALHFVGSLLERDLRLLSKSKHVSTAVAGAARRMLLERGRG